MQGMPTLVVHTDTVPSGMTRLVRSQVEVWLSVRGVEYRVLGVDSAELSLEANKASAIISLGACADGGSVALSRFLRQLPEDQLAGKPFLSIRSAALDADSDSGLGGLWLALQRAGIGVLLKPVLLEGLPGHGDGLSARDSRLLSEGLLALVESLDFCRRLRQKQESLELAEFFAHAPLLA
jgi:hypothetical protein